MKVVFLNVDNVLNDPDSDAKAPSGRLGIAEPKVKEFKKFVIENEVRIVLIGSWRKEWNFDDARCSADGVYLNKKLGRKGLHILDKISDGMSDQEGIDDWIRRHPNVTESCVLTDANKEVKWTEW